VTDPGLAVVAMSGGVDSSVAAAELLGRGATVVGVTLRLQDCDQTGESRSCCGSDGVARARAVAEQLQIRHYVLDAVRAFSDRVLVHAWHDYQHGRTPSPCLLCNEQIKFGVLLEWARGLGASCVVTGHYARVTTEHEGVPRLFRGRDHKKDQSYFLAGLTREQLRYVRFPLGGLTKTEVRQRAAALGLATAETRESQDACLVGQGESFAEMLRSRFAAPRRAGIFVDEQGRSLGEHRGLHLYTIGQRKGLPPSTRGPRYVTRLSVVDDTVHLSHDPRALLSTRLRASGVHWLAEPLGDHPRSCLVQVRAHQAPTAAELLCGEVPGMVEVRFASPVRAAAPGQAAVFYDDERVLGRGWIEEASDDRAALAWCGHGEDGA